VSALFNKCPDNTGQTGTEKVDPARKFKCTTAAPDKGLKDTVVNRTCHSIYVGEDRALTLSVYI